MHGIHELRRVYSFYTVLFRGEAFLLGEATDTELGEFSSLACRKMCCLECLGAKQAEDS